MTDAAHATRSVTWQWCVPGIVDFKEWRTSHISDLAELGEACLKELIQGSNLYRVWRDRSVYIFFRDALTKETKAVKQVEYEGNDRFTLFSV